MNVCRSKALVPSLAAAGAALAVYLMTQGPSFYWLDSAEFVAAAWSLGVAHPPGHPLAALLARLACYLPVGTIAFRVGLASALQGAATVWMLCLISLELFRRMPAGTTEGGSLALHGAALDKVLSLVGALLPAFSYALWFHGVRAEVYALNTFLLALAVYLLLRAERAGDPRHAVAACFVVGLALCNHHLLVLLALPGLALLAASSLARGRRRARTLLCGLLAGALGLTIFAYLPLRSNRAPRVNWGAPHTVDRFAWVVSARAFQQKSRERAAKETIEHRGVGATFALLAGPPSSGTPMVAGATTGLLALYGLVLLLRVRGARWAGSGLFLAVVFELLGPMLVGFDPFNPDAHGYLAFSVALLGPLAALALRVAARAHGRTWTALIVSIVGLMLVGSSFRANHDRVDLSQHWGADETARATLRLPPGALLVTSYFQTIFGIWALQASEDARPDVAVVHRGFAAQPGYFEAIARRDASLAALLDAWRQAGDLEPSILKETLAERPVALEYDLTLPEPIVQRTVPAGLMLAVTRGGAQSPDAMRDAIRRHLPQIAGYQARVPHALADLETRRALVWRHYLLAHYGCRRGLSALARFHLSQALHLAPRSRHLQALARGCLHEAG